MSPSYQSLITELHARPQPPKRPGMLKDMLGKQLMGWVITPGYYLQDNHGLMAFTTAVRTDTSDMAVFLRLEVAEEARQLLDTSRRDRTKVQSRLALTNGTWVYFLSELGERAVAVPVMNRQDLEQLCMNKVEPLILQDFAA